MTWWWLRNLGILRYIYIYIMIIYDYIILYMYEMCMTRYWTYTAVPQLGSSSSSSSSTCDHGHHGHHGHKMAPWHPHELVGTGGEFTGHPGFSYISSIYHLYMFIYMYMFIWNLRVWGKFSLCPSLGIVGTNISTWHTWHSFSFAQFSTWGYVKPISSNTKIQCVYIIYIHRIHSLILDDLGYPYCWNIRIGVTQFSLPKPSIFWLLFKVPFFMVTSPDIPTGPSIFLLNTVENISPLFSHFSTESLLFALPSVLVGWTGQ